MKNLMNQIQARTKSNLVKQTKKKNICDHLHELLFEQNQTMTRLEVINHITLYRLKQEFNDLKDDSVLTEKQLKRLDSIMITVKNGLDTAVCNGTTGSSYVSNANYQDYQLVKTADKLSIIKKTKSTK